MSEPTIETILSELAAIARRLDTIGRTSVAVAASDAGKANRRLDEHQAALLTAWGVIVGVVPERLRHPLALDELEDHVDPLSDDATPFDELAALRHEVAGLRLQMRAFGKTLVTLGS